ncbi:MAG: LysM peptidoglycan-binding domain-containing protein [Aggregatilineales bacterium]
MIPRRTIFLSLVLALMLTGCFRQASEPFETVEGSQSGDALDVQATVPVLVTATIEEEATLDTLPTDALNPTDELVETIPTIEPLTTEVPTEQTDNTQQNNQTDTLPTLGAAVTSTPIIVQPTNTDAPLAIPSETPVPVATNANDTGAESSNTSPTLTPTFITPGVAAGTSVSPTINITPAAGTPATATPSGLITPTDFLNPSNIPEQCLYIVRTGDNLFRIAINNGLSLDQLRAANPQIRSDVIQPGDQLLLPVAGCDGETLSSDPVVTESAPASAQDQIVHIVQSGETVGQIARRYGTTIAAIALANNLSDPNRLSIGQQLIIPQN